MQQIGFLAFCFLGLSLINRILEGVMTQASDIAILSSLYIFRPVKVLWFTLSVPNISFFTEGVPHLFKLDYTFFGGNAGLITYFFYAITVMVSFMLLALFVNLIFSRMSRS